MWEQVQAQPEEARTGAKQNSFLHASLHAKEGVAWISPLSMTQRGRKKLPCDPAVSRFQLSP